MSVNVNIGSSSASTNQPSALAPRYRDLHPNTLQNLIVLPPYGSNSTNTAVQWVRGYCKIPTNAGQPNLDFVITGPSLRVVYGGCRYNKIVFLTEQSNHEFYEWLKQVSDIVKQTIWANPMKFKPGAVNSNRFTFDHSLYVEDNDEGTHLKCRLSSYRDHTVQSITTGEDGTIQNYQDIIDTYFFTQDPSTLMSVPVGHTEIQSGGYIKPVIRIGYIRNNDRFSLTLTVLKGKYSPPNILNTRVPNSNWEIDMASDNEN